MKHLAVTLFVLLATLAATACGKKDADSAGGAAKPTTASPAEPAQTPTAPTPAAAKPPVALPPECKEFTAAFDALTACDKLAAGRDEMKKGYEKMLKAMIDLGDVKAMADGCKQGLDGLKLALKTAGC